LAHYQFIGKEEADMAEAVFDSLAYFERLKDAGFTEKQAKVQTEALREIVEERLATKNDLAGLERVMKADIANVEMRLTNELQKLELRMTTKLGAMLAASIAIIAALVKLL